MINVNISLELAFWRTLTLSSTREAVTANKLLSHPIGAVPTSLFHDDGTVRRCANGDIGHKLEEQVAKCTILPAYDAQQQCDGHHTGATSSPVSHVWSLGVQFCQHPVFSFWDNKTNTVVYLYDQYNNDLSIKAAERKWHTTDLDQQKYLVIGGRAIPPWKCSL